jgi:double zinc ribbon protein
MTTTANVYCPACGRELPAGAAFCGECGHDLTSRKDPAWREPEVDAPETRSCLQCETVVPAAAQFCPSCGDAMSTESLMPTLELEPPAEPVLAAAEPPPSPRRPDVRVVAIAVAAVLLVGGGLAFALTSGGDSTPETENAARAGTQTAPDATVGAPTPEPTVEFPTPEPTVEATTPEPTVEAPTPEPTVEPDLAAEVQQLNSLMQMSVQGRAAAVSGDMAAAIAARTRLLRELRSLRAEAADPELQAAVDAFIPAIREALRQNRECGSACSAQELSNVGRLKREALSELNPLLREYVGRTYRREEI